MRTFFALVAALGSSLAFATVNVNTAQQSELERTKGLDKVKAKSIIEWRAANGPIDNFDELRKVPGFTPDVIERVKQDVAFEGDPYVPPPKPVKKKPGAATPAPRVQALR